MRRDAGKAGWITGAILALCLALRLSLAWMPLAGVHAWRQCDTATVARNFAIESMNPFMPRVDWRGDGPGLVEMELPLFPWVVAVAYRVLGVHDAIGRIAAALGGVAACWWLLCLVTRTSGPTVARWAALLFAILPLNVYYGAAFMPESWMIAASIGGVHHFLRWREGGGGGHGWASFACIAMAVLLKPTALCLGLVLAWILLAVRPERGPFATGHPLRDLRAWCFAAGVFALLSAWMWWAHRLGQETGLSFGVLRSDKFADWPLAGSLGFWHTILVERLAERHLAWGGAALALAGLLRPRSSPLERLFDVWLVAVLIGTAIASKGNELHEYYQMPWSLPLAFFAGRGAAGALSRQRGWFVALALATLGVLGPGRLLEYTGTTRRHAGPLLATARAMHDHGVAPLPVIVVSTIHPGDPSLLHHAGAKGWLAHPDQLDEATVASLRSRGAAYVCGVHRTFMADPSGTWWNDLLISLGRGVPPAAPRQTPSVSSLGEVVHEDEHGFIVKLRP